MDKRTIIIYCGEDGNAGRAEATRRRDDETVTHLACAFHFDGQPEQCAMVVVMPDVPDFCRDKITDAYTCKVDVLRGRAAPRTSAPSSAVPHDLAADIAGEAAKAKRRRRKLMPSEPDLMMPAAIVGEGV